MVDTWNDDPKNAPDPYEEPELGTIKHAFLLYDFELFSAGTTVADVRRELNKEEAEELSRGELPLHQTSASQFLQTGLDLEEQQ